MWNTVFISITSSGRGWELLPGVAFFFVLETREESTADQGLRKANGRNTLDP